MHLSDGTSWVRTKTHIGRIVELSHELHPGGEEYKLEVLTQFVEALLPSYKRKEGVWYVMSEITMWSHVGTHIESPFHYLREGKDVSAIPLHRLVGEAIVLNFTHKGCNEPITMEEMNERGRDIRDNDIVLLRTDLSRFYNTEHSHDRPYLTFEAASWLVSRNIACLGMDCSGFEIRGLDDQPIHSILFNNDIPVIEHLTNLDQLSTDRVLLIVLPLRIRGLDACPVRVVAIEGFFQNGKR